MLDPERRRQAGGHEFNLHLTYRPPYDWERLRDFLAQRAITGLEWVGDDHYGRSVVWQGAKGHFTAYHEPGANRFRVVLVVDEPNALEAMEGNIRRVLDVDRDTQAIETHLTQAVPGLALVEGLRLPGIWSQFEAGIKAVLGQQVSVAAARRLAQHLVDALGEPWGESQRHFPEPAAIAENDLAFLGMPGSRRDAVRRLAEWHVNHGNDHEASEWLILKGIGPWTVNYARMRGASHPDIWLGGDLGVKKALGELGGADPDAAAPWRSYLTFQLWNR